MIFVKIVSRAVGGSPHGSISVLQVLIFIGESGRPLPLPVHQTRPFLDTIV